MWKEIQENVTRVFQGKWPFFFSPAVHTPYSCGSNFKVSLSAVCSHCHVHIVWTSCNKTLLASRFRCHNLKNCHLDKSSPSDSRVKKQTESTANCDLDQDFRVCHIRLRSSHLQLVCANLVLGKSRMRKCVTCTCYVLCTIASVLIILCS